jgi:hypothetical protein
MVQHFPKLKKKLFVLSRWNGKAFQVVTCVQLTEITYVYQYSILHVYLAHSILTHTVLQ